MAPPQILAPYRALAGLCTLPLCVVSILTTRYVDNRSFVTSNAQARPAYTSLVVRFGIARPRRAAPFLPSGLFVAAATTRTIRFRAGFIYGEGPTVKVLPVYRGDGRLCLGIVCHFHEAKSLGPACIAISNQTNAFNSSITRKERPDTVFRGSKTEVSNKKFLHHLVLYLGLKGS